MGKDTLPHIQFSSDNVLTNPGLLRLLMKKAMNTKMIRWCVLQEAAQAAMALDEETMSHLASASSWPSSCQNGLGLSIWSSIGFYWLW